MDDAATTVIYQEREAQRLRVIDVATGRGGPLGPDDRGNFAPVLSADGAWVLYLSRIGGEAAGVFQPARRVGLAAVDGPRGPGVREATLSGDGRVAWVAADDGAVLRMRHALGRGGAADRADAGVTGPADGAVGSAVIAHRLGPGYRHGRCGWRAAAGRAAHGGVAVSDSRGLSEVDDGVGWSRAATPRSTPPFPLRVRTWSPAALGQAIHADFSALVTPENPAAPGEIVHLYATGLGPVADSRVTLPWEWLWSGSGDRRPRCCTPGSRRVSRASTRWTCAFPPIRRLAALPLDLQLKTPDGGWFRWNMATIPVRP